MEESKVYKLLKGIFRIQTGFALVRVWSLNEVYPRKTNLHLFGLINKVRRRRTK